MPVEWLQGAVRARCPVCGVAGEKRGVLTAEHVIPGTPRITFLRCDCGAAFLDDLTPPDYGEDTPEMLDYYVEQGAGIDLIVAPLLRVPPASVRRCLEIGCSFPFALDFARFAFGWDILGVDPSPLAVKGAEALGVPVRHAYFDADLDVGREPLDLERRTANGDAAAAAIVRSRHAPARVRAVRLRGGRDVHPCRNRCRNQRRDRLRLCRGAKPSCNEADGPPSAAAAEGL